MAVTFEPCPETGAADHVVGSSNAGPALQKTPAPIRAAQRPTGPPAALVSGTKTTERTGHVTG
jgi:hypothetical protein